MKRFSKSGKLITLFSSVIAVLGSLTLVFVTILSSSGKIVIKNDRVMNYCEFFHEDESFLYGVYVEHGQDAIYRGVQPEKKPDGQFNYVFTGWDKTLRAIKTDTKFTAMFAEKRRDYEITFVNYDGTPLYVSEVQAGDLPVYLGPEPTKPGTASNTYQFAGWDQPIVKAVKNTAYTAQFQEVEKYYNVTFKNYDGTLLETKEVPYNGSATYGGQIPQRPNDSSFEYVFDGWDPMPIGIVKDTTVFATFKKLSVDHIVTFVNYDDQVLYILGVLHGETALYPLADPERPWDNEFVYQFTGWSESLSKITNDMTVKAEFEKVLATHEVTFKNYDGTILEVVEVEHNQTAVFTKNEPQRPSDEQYIYTFIGWDRNLDNVGNDFFTIALYDAELKIYNVRFCNYDKTLLEEVKVLYGDEAIPSGPVPTRPNSEYYRYEFTGWSHASELTFIRRDLETYALFEAIPLQETTGDDGSTTGGNGDGIGGGGGGIGKIPPILGIPDYYIATFLNWDSKLLGFDGIIKGNDAYYEGETPERLPSKGYTYRFQDFDFPLTNVQNGFETYAQFIAEGPIVDEYIVTFRNSDGSLLYEDIVDYNDVPQYRLTTPPTHPDDNNVTFVGWDRQLVPTQKSYTVYAVYRVLILPGLGGNGPGSGGNEPGEGEGPDEGSGSDEKPEGAPTSGDISGAGPGELSDTPVFSVSTSYKSQLYLREQSYGDLSKNRWQPAAKYEMPDGAARSPVFFTNELLEQHAFDRYPIDIKYLADHYISIIPDYVTGSLKTIGDDYVTQFIDGEINFNRHTTHQFMPFALNEIDFTILNNDPLSYSGDHAHRDSYETYVYNNYLSLGPEEKTYIESFINEHNFRANSLTDIINIKDFMQRFGEYNIDFEPYPAGSNYLIHFLDVAKEGICNNYASALTAIYRGLGIPARYVTGYAPLVKTTYGEFVDVSSKSAHAWTEIYFGKIGWVHVEATPGGGVGSGDSSSGTGESNDNKFGPFDPFTDKPIIMSIKPDQDTKIYDGLPTKLTGSYTGELDEGHYIDYGIYDQGKNVGTYESRARPTIYDETGKDVSKAYRGRVKLVNCEYTITPRTITIETGSGEKIRDGSPLVVDEYILFGELAINDQIYFDIIGSQTRPGTSANNIDYQTLVILNEDGENVTNNYIIIWRYGTLVVT